MFTTEITTMTTKEKIEQAANRTTVFQEQFTKGAIFVLQNLTKFDEMRELMIEYAIWHELNAVRNGQDKWVVGCGESQKQFTSLTLYGYFLASKNGKELKEYERKLYTPENLDKAKHYNLYRADQFKEAYEMLAQNI